MEPKPLDYLFDAVHHGKYDFADFLHDDVSSGYTSVRVKQRTVRRPKKELKAYLTFLNTFLFDYLEVNHRVVYSYRKGVNPHEVALAHASSRAFFQADFKNFFESIDRTLAESTIRSQVTRTPISDLERYIERILDLTTVNGFLPIGFPTSPPISNACLTPFDNNLEQCCLSGDLVYTRYADDIVISGQSRDALLTMKHTLSELLAQHFAGKLTLNRDKCKLTTVGRKTRIMGMVILPNGHVTIDMELKKKIEVLLHYYIRNPKKFTTISGGDFDSGVRKLSGYINYVNAADQSYLQKLRRKFGVTVIDSLVHQSAS